MSWNYRVTRERVEHDGEVSHLYEIREVYSDANGQPQSISTCSIAPMGESIAELSRDLDRMREALDRPIVEYASIGQQIIAGLEEAIEYEAQEKAKGDAC